MTEGLYFHFAVLVEDIDAAIERFSGSLGLTFNAPTLVHFHELEDSEGSREAEARVSYSKDGPPHLELIEATGDGVFSLHQGEGFHHVGFWHSDLESRAKELAKQGLRREAAIRNADGELFVFFTDPKDLHGTRLEFIDERRRPGLERWFATGEFPH